MSCGAHGLNLTVANRAMILNRWWHKCLERQAFARIHRIGQTKEVHAAKIVVADSMDGDILRLQATKEESIAAVIEGGPEDSLDEELIDSDGYDFLGHGDLEADGDVLAGVAKSI